MATGDSPHPASYKGAAAIEAMRAWLVPRDFALLGADIAGSRSGRRMEARGRGTFPKEHF